MLKKCLKIMFLLFVLCLITVLFLDNDGTFGLFAAFVGILTIWNN